MGLESLGNRKCVQKEGNGGSWSGLIAAAKSAERGFRPFFSVFFFLSAVKEDQESFVYTSW